VLPVFLARNAQLLLFGLIGCVNTLIHGGVLVLMVECWFVDVTVSHFFAFCVANLLSYLMNSLLTFRVGLTLRRYIRFFVASLLSLGMTVLLSWVADAFGLHYLIGFGLIVLLVPLLSFLVMKFWAFSGIHDVPRL